MPSELDHYSVADHVAHVVLDSPHNKNALSRQLVAELIERLQRAEADDDVKVIVLRAEGNVFCSGADLSEMHADPEDAPRGMVALFRAIVAHAKPVVASVQGAVRAGGIEQRRCRGLRHPHVVEGLLRRAEQVGRGHQHWISPRS